MFFVNKQDADALFESGVVPNKVRHIMWRKYGHDVYPTVPTGCIRQAVAYPAGGGDGVEVPDLYAIELSCYTEEGDYPFTVEIAELEGC